MWERYVKKLHLEISESGESGLVARAILQSCFSRSHKDRTASPWQSAVSLTLARSELDTLPKLTATFESPTRRSVWVLRGAGHLVSD